MAPGVFRLMHLARNMPVSILKSLGIQRFPTTVFANECRVNVATPAHRAMALTLGCDC